MRTAVVVCPGRGTYNRAELGYLRDHFPDPAQLACFDGIRRAAGRPALTELDAAERFSVARHTQGDNAAALIFAATVGDFETIRRAGVEVVAVTGNSMGWYSALACGGAVSVADGFRIADTMGTLMQRSPVGGQLVHPCMDDDWRPRPERRAELLAHVANIAAAEGATLYPSIDLGGMLVLAGDEAGLAAFERSVEPVQGRFPLRLANHAAFHTPLMRPVSDQGREALPVELFGDPTLPLVDGRGAIWWPGTVRAQELRDYTLGTQVVERYDFTSAIAVAAREFAPDMFIVTGPGNTLGGAVAQSLILAGWKGIGSKSDFQALQRREPRLLSLGLVEQRETLLTHGGKGVAAPLRTSAGS